jgi:PPK2 family polyphosphate:nucleotide phosphotransferase
MKLKPVNPKKRIRLRDADARFDKDVPSDDEIEADIEKLQGRIGKLQKAFYANGQRALLIVLQGRDASGKDGAIRNVFASVDPQGCEVTSFKVPTPLELEHDFLWRVHQRVPARGMIGIWNRSHYEDVLVVRVRKFVPEAVWEARYDQINDFERMLVANRVIVLKFFLHVSRGEQKERLEARLKDPSKNWKFRAGDLDDRAKWAAYTAAYTDAIKRCSTDEAPWYIVPADSKKVRDLLMMRVIADTLGSLDLEYPKASKEVLALKIE